MFKLFNSRPQKTDNELIMLKNTLENGMYYDAAEAAKALVERGDYSCREIMIARMQDHRMAVPLSRIPDESVMIPLILAISKYAILNLSVSTGNESFSPFDVSQIFRNLAQNFQDRAYAYLAEIRDYHFFFMKDGRLLYMQGSRSLNKHLDRPDLIAQCARDVLRSIPEERIQAAVNNEKQNYQYAGNMSRSEILSLL